jgi:hypothetical protein
MADGDGTLLNPQSGMRSNPAGARDMPKVIVYNVKRYDPYTDETIILPRMATREGARALGGDIIEGTAVEIDETRLEPGERFTPPDFEP